MSHLVSYKSLGKTKIYHNLGDFTRNGKSPRIFTSNIRCIGNSILGLLGCRILSETFGE